MPPKNQEPAVAITAEKVERVFGSGPSAFRALGDVSLEIPDVTK